LFRIKTEKLDLLLLKAVEDKGKQIKLYMNIGKLQTVVSNDWNSDKEVNIGGSVQNGGRPPS